jgi:hypothetical protein
MSVRQPIGGNRWTRKELNDSTVYEKYSFEMLINKPLKNNMLVHNKFHIQITTFIGVLIFIYMDMYDRQFQKY